MFISKSVLIFCVCLLLAPLDAMAEGDVSGLNDILYWDNGKIRSCTVYDATGHLKAKAYCRNDGTVEKIEKFDLAGNRTEESFYDQSGRLKNGIDGWAARRWWYEDSRTISQITYDEDGRQVERRHYSESGRLVLRQYRDDDNLDPYEGAAMQLLLGSQNIPYRDPRVQD
ncbi:MAG: hypothetical protein WC592_04985 [Candidatus Omnitrophota bacterium]|nr:hypothetical protein [Candidatus Omnitrophota bacterium]